MAKLVTQADYDRIRKMLENKQSDLKILRKKKADTAASCGDMWHDNPLFTDMEQKEKSMMKTIRELKEDLVSLEIIEPDTNCKDVQIGKIVVLQLDDDEEETVEIVGHMNGNPPERIAYDSPLGNAIMNALPGDIRSFTVEDNNITVTIKRVI